MSKLTEFYMRTEDFIKRKVDVALMTSLSDEAFGRFIEKMVILLSRDTHPKSVYGLRKEDVRRIFVDVLCDITKPKKISIKDHNAYSYVTPFREYRMVFARSKKEAREIVRTLPIGVSAVGRMDSLRKVSAVYSTYLVVDNGEQRAWEPWKHTINLYGMGGGSSE